MNHTSPKTIPAEHTIQHQISQFKMRGAVSLDRRGAALPPTRLPRIISNILIALHTHPITAARGDAEVRKDEECWAGDWLSAEMQKMYNCDNSFKQGKVAMSKCCFNKTIAGVQTCIRTKDIVYRQSQPQHKMGTESISGKICTQNQGSRQHLADNSPKAKQKHLKPILHASL